MARNEAGRKDSGEPFGGLDDTGGLGAVHDAKKKPGGVGRGKDDAGRFEDADVTSADIAREAKGPEPRRHRDTNQEAGQDEDPGDRRPL